MKLKLGSNAFFNVGVVVPKRSSHSDTQGEGVRRWVSLQTDLTQLEIQLFTSISYFCDLHGYFHLSVFDIKKLVNWETKEVVRILIELKKKRFLTFYFNLPEKPSRLCLELVRLFRSKVKNRILRKTNELGANQVTKV
jgi:hypothetical protein